MTRIGIFFGSTTGNTAEVASLIRDELGEEQITVQSIADATVGDLAGCDFLIFGCSTWGYGEPQDDWAAFLDHLKDINFTGKKVALFGLGDQEGYTDTFLDGMGLLHEEIGGRDDLLVGRWPTKGYEFTASKAVVGGEFVGLAIDQDNQADMTGDRVRSWVNQLKRELC